MSVIKPVTEGTDGAAPVLRARSVTNAVRTVSSDFDMRLGDMNNIHDLVDALVITLGMLIDLHRQSFTRDESNAILRFAEKLKAEAIRQSALKETPTAANLEHAAKLLALSVPDDLIEPLRAEWGNSNLAVLKHWRDEVLAVLASSPGIQRETKDKE